MSSSLTRLPQSLDQYSQLVWKVSYTTQEQALTGKLDSVFCSNHTFTIGTSTATVERKSDIIAVMRSGEVEILFTKAHGMTSMYLQYIRAPILCADFCECRRVESVGSEVGGSGDSEGSLSVEECSDLINIQELCSGTIASPCDCQTSQQCQVYWGITLLYVNLSITNPHTHAHTYARMTHTFTHSVYLPMLEMGHCVY